MIVEMTIFTLFYEVVRRRRKLPAGVLEMTFVDKVEGCRTHKNVLCSLHVTFVGARNFSSVK